MSADVLSGQHRAASRDGRGLEVILSSSDTGKALAIVDCFVPAATAGPPVHVHPASDETFIVLAGTLLMYVDGHVAAVSEGAVHVSRGTRHTFATPPGSSAHFMTVHTPGGFEEFHVAAAAAEKAAGGPLPQAELIKLAGGYDWAVTARRLPTAGQAR